MSRKGPHVDRNMAIAVNDPIWITASQMGEEVTWFLVISTIVLYVKAMEQGRDDWGLGRIERRYTTV